MLKKLKLLCEVCTPVYGCLLIPFSNVFSIWILLYVVAFCKFPKIKTMVPVIALYLYPCVYFRLPIFKGGHVCVGSIFGFVHNMQRPKSSPTNRTIITPQTCPKVM